MISKQLKLKKICSTYWNWVLIFKKQYLGASVFKVRLSSMLVSSLCKGSFRSRILRLIFFQLWLIRLMIYNNEKKSQFVRQRLIWKYVPSSECCNAHEYQKNNVQPLKMYNAQCACFNLSIPSLHYLCFTSHYNPREVRKWSLIHQNYAR